MKKSLWLFALALVLAFFSVALYPTLVNRAQLSPGGDAYKLAYDTASKETKQLCNGNLGMLLNTISKCRTTQMQDQNKCVSMKDVESCTKEVKETLQSCVSLALNKYCPELIK